MMKRSARMEKHSPGFATKLSSTVNLSNGSRFSTTKGARWLRLDVERGHRCPEPCEGDFECDTSKGGFWFSRRPSGYDKGMLVRSPTNLGLTPAQDSVANQQDYVDLGLFCAEVCKALERGLNGRRLDEISDSVLQAIKQLTE